MQLQGLAHVGLFVTDLKRSLAFYTDKLGFRVIWENSNPSPEGDVQVAFAQSGDFVMELAQFPHPQQRTDGWFDHIALRVKDLDAAMAQLAE
ncbi:MAG: VOC family protein [Ruthenibacterium sp.]